MCLINVYFFLDVISKQRYINNQDNMNTWETFKNGLSGLFGDRQKHTRKSEEQLKQRAQHLGESIQPYIQAIVRLCQEVYPGMSDDEKVSHLMKGLGYFHFAKKTAATIRVVILEHVTKV